MKLSVNGISKMVKFIEHDDLLLSELHCVDTLPFEASEHKLFEENSFDEIDAAKEREKQQQDSKDPNKKATAPLRTGFVTEPRKKGDPAQPQIFILSSGEITPFVLTL